jgi:RNA polymerase sigma-70 factor, ECF subfamily
MHFVGVPKGSEKQLQEHEQEATVATCVVQVTNVVPPPAKTVPALKRDCELQIVSRAKQGDEEAFAALFQAHKKRVYTLCLRMTGDVADAEDLTQDAFIQVFRKIHAFRGDSAFSTWLYRVAVNTVLMKLRTRKTREVSLDEPICLEHSFVPREYGLNDLHLQGTIDRIALIRAISELPKGYREIFILHEVAGYGHQEIAQLLHCSIGNTKSQLHKARLKIREFLLRDKKRQDMAQPLARSSKPSQSRVVAVMTAAARFAQTASKQM